MDENSLTVDDPKIFLNISGVNDKNLRYIESISGSSISSNGKEIYFEGDNSYIVRELINNLILIVSNGGNVYKNLINILYTELEHDINVNLKNILNSKIEIPKAKKIFSPKSLAQAFYIEELHNNDIIFSYGPAGTGKTFLAVAYSISELLNKNIKKIVLTRPVVEAGESLGFLPGDFIQKINPYLLPLFDSIVNITSTEMYQKLSEQNLIEIAPIAYMRGRTFENSIVILDEGQNTTYTQRKLFLTRLGEGAKLIITGDITQIDLPRNVKSGMVEALNILKNIDGISIVQFSENDVIRHPLVKKIVNAYNKHEKEI
jgi:phosphate starvation-inducible PhoH-like protein